MNPRTIILMSVVALVCFGCSRRDPGKVALAVAMRDSRLDSAHGIKHREGGLREQVDELFFRANPIELKDALSKAGFVRDDAVPAVIRGANTSFKELVGSADQPTAIGFRRADLTTKEGKDCRLLCAEDFTWAYLIYVDYGKS